VAINGPYAIAGCRDRVPRGSRERGVPAWRQGSGAGSPIARTIEGGTWRGAPLPRHVSAGRYPCTFTPRRPEVRFGRVEVFLGCKWTLGKIVSHPLVSGHPGEVACSITISVGAWACWCFRVHLSGPFRLGGSARTGGRMPDQTPASALSVVRT
jgi:hypothetical protein